MSENSTLNKKLKAYSAVAGAIVAASTSADAQVVYTDVNPDTTVNTVNGAYMLDLNNDGTVDFALSYVQVPITFNTTGGGTAVYTYDVIVAAGNNATTNQVDTATTQSPANPGFPQSDSHGAGFSVNSGGLWFAGYGTGYTHFLAAASTALPATYNWGNWNGAVDQYLALKFDIGGQTHYGWVRLDVAQNANSFTVKDYAYDSTANTPSVTGVVNAIATVEGNGVAVSQVNDVVRVDLGTTTGADVVITDLSGRTVMGSHIENGTADFDLTGQASGIYLVSVRTAEGVTTQKVMIN